MSQDATRISVPEAPDPTRLAPAARSSRRWGRFVAIVGIPLCLAGGFALARFWSPDADLRVTTGPAGGIAQRFMAAFVSVSEIQHPRVHLELVQVADLTASAKALEEGRTDLALAHRRGAARERTDDRDPAS